MSLAGWAGSGPESRAFQIPEQVSWPNSSAREERVKFKETKEKLEKEGGAGPPSWVRLTSLGWGQGQQPQPNVSQLAPLKRNPNVVTLLQKSPNITLAQICSSKVCLEGAKDRKVRDEG